MIFSKIAAVIIKTIYLGWSFNFIRIRRDSQRTPIGQSFDDVDRSAKDKLRTFDGASQGVQCQCQLLAGGGEFKL